MAGAQLSTTKDATYHAIKATEEWANFILGMNATISRSLAQRQRRDAERKRETTYARGVEGGH